jgi:hypothetical protein
MQEFLEVERDALFGAITKDAARLFLMLALLPLEAGEITQELVRPLTELRLATPVSLATPKWHKLNESKATLHLLNLAYQIYVLAHAWWRCDPSMLELVKLAGSLHLNAKLLEERSRPPEPRRSPRRPKQIDKPF